MMKSGLNRRFALGVGAIAVVGMGFTVGCSSKQAPAPTAPTQNSVDAKLPQGEPDANQSGPAGAKSPAKAQPSVKAKPAPTAKPGNTPGDN